MSGLMRRRAIGIHSEPQYTALEKWIETDLSPRTCQYGDMSPFVKKKECLCLVAR